MIPLDRIKACSKATCRAVLSADPDDEQHAGFWVGKRDDRGRPTVWQSRCKDCMREANRARREGQHQGSRRPSKPITWRTLDDGRSVPWRQCASCDREGPVTLGPESLFGATSEGGTKRFRNVCRFCYSEYQRDYHRRQSDEQRKYKLARQRQRRAELVSTDPEYRAHLAQKRREYYQTRKKDPEFREQRRRAERRYRATHREQRAETARFQRRLKAEREGRKVRKGRSVIDGTVPRIYRQPYARWLRAYMAARAIPEHSSDQAAMELGIIERRVRAVLKGEQPNVSVDTVCRSLTNSVVLVELDGRPIFTIDDLYPDLDALGGIRG